MSANKLYALLVIVVLAMLVGIFVMQRMSTKPMNGTATSPHTADGVVRYLPLGDSYTIGESVAESDRWPNQLVYQVAQTNGSMQIVGNPSVTGYTTQDLIKTELPLVKTLQPDFVTILIGVNDYVQGVDSATFQKNLTHIVETIQHELPNASNMLLVTIPDFAKTPTGAQFGDPAQLTAGVEAFNTIIKSVGTAKNVPVADIFGVSQAVANDSSLIAPDGLHPSAKEYAAWTSIVMQTMQSHSLPLNGS